MDKHYNGSWAPTNIDPCRRTFSTLSSKKYISGYLYLRHSHRHYNVDPSTGRIDPSASNDAGALNVEYTQTEKPDSETILLAAEACGLALMPRPTLPAKDGMWCKYWVEHVGLTMRLWRVPEDVAALPYANAPNADVLAGMELAPHKNIISLVKLVNPYPFSLSVAHIEADIIPMNEALQRLSLEQPPPPIPYDSFLSITTINDIELVMAAPSSIQANSWVASIRLAIYELARLSEYFTLTIMKDPPFYRIWHDRQLMPFTNKLANGSKPTKNTGSLQAMFGKSHEWRNYYAVVSSVQVPLGTVPTAGTGSLPSKAAEGASTAEKKKNKKLFRLSAEQHMVYVGQLLLYEKKSDARPVKKVVQISESYLIWPNSAAMGDLSDAANVLRVEGIVIDEKNDRRSSVLHIDISAKPAPDKKLRRSDSSESLASSKSSLPIPSDAKPETFYLRFADSWDACQWNAAFMANFHTDADLYERDRQLREGELGLAADKLPSNDGNSSRSSSPGLSLMHQDSLPHLPPSEVNSMNNKGSSTPSLIPPANKNDKSNRNGVVGGSSGVIQPDAIEIMGTSTVTPSSSSSDAGLENSTDSLRNPGSIPNWMGSYPEPHEESRWGLLYLRASEVCNLSMAGVSTCDAVREFGMTLKDKRRHQENNDMAKWNMSVKRDRAQRRASEWHEAETKASHLLRWLATQGIPVSVNDTPNSDAGGSGPQQQVHHNEFVSHPVFPDTVFIRAPTNERPYGMTTVDLNPSLELSNAYSKRDAVDEVEANTKNIQSTSPTASTERKMHDEMVVAPERKLGLSLPPPMAPPRVSRDVISGKKGQEASSMIVEKPSSVSHSVSKPETQASSLDKSLPATPVSRNADIDTGSAEEGDSIVAGQLSRPPPRVYSRLSSAPKAACEFFSSTNSDIVTTQSDAPVRFDNTTVSSNNANRSSGSSNSPHVEARPTLKSSIGSKPVLNGNNSTHGIFPSLPQVDLLSPLVVDGVSTPPAQTPSIRDDPLHGDTLITSGDGQNGSSHDNDSTASPTSAEDLKAQPSMEVVHSFGKNADWKETFGVVARGEVL
ncbi:hypothetical protein SeLEV6574_g04397 [Synchytrium endobioticum]|uniref:Skg3/CAF120-like PH-like domain-containing protein n=1 Tax=Synchytrium endobioticum TaxID=286115 RepID=A0A507CZH9_9FUNG|nr:hypothetical protein SeLEV6574_g04397 [Synchytrium endobioticum]